MVVTCLTMRYKTSVTWFVGWSGVICHVNAQSDKWTGNQCNDICIHHEGSRDPSWCTNLTSRAWLSRLLLHLPIVTGSKKKSCLPAVPAFFKLIWFRRERSFFSVTVILTSHHYCRWGGLSGYAPTICTLVFELEVSATKFALTSYDLPFRYEFLPFRQKFLV